MPVLTDQQRINGAIKSAQVRRSNKEELTKLRAIVAAFQEANPPKPPPQQSEAYTMERLVRVRKQLDRLDEMLMQEEDPQKLDRLVSASSRLEEQERKLSGRFAPGTTKPTTARQQRAAVVPQAVPEPVPYGLKLMPATEQTQPEKDKPIC